MLRRKGTFLRKRKSQPLRLRRCVFLLLPFDFFTLARALEVEGNEFLFYGQSGRRNEVLARRFRHRKIRISLAFLCSFLIRTRGRDTVDISKGKILKTFSLFATSSCCDVRRSSERYERTQRVVRELFELFRAWIEKEVCARARRKKNMIKRQKLTSLPLFYYLK